MAILSPCGLYLRGSFKALADWAATHQTQLWRTPFCGLQVVSLFPLGLPMASAVIDLTNCLFADRLGPSLSFASAALFLFEYSVTFFDELRFVWFQRFSASTFLFCVVRYVGMASSIVTLVQTPTTSLLLANMSTTLRVIVIVASEAILAVRTWAIWEKKRSVLIFLCVISAAALGANVTLVLRGVNATHVVEIPGQDCIIVVDSKSQAYLVPYLVVIAYECITISLSAARIFKWRRQITPAARTPLLDTLWNDGLLYFSWLIGLGIVNVLLIFHGSVATRTGGAQLQTSIHSMLSSRIILHLATLSARRQQDRTNTHVSSLFTPTTLQLTSELSTINGDFSYYDLG
ncbi:hypothetical protein FB451DRAFT_1256225 [Mycena latifolia]|nr:hypothetical protein FB451DRAFT_1256225 [Mycena latifolia]